MIYTNIGALFDILKKDYGGKKEDLKERERERNMQKEG